MKMSSNKLTVYMSRLFLTVYLLLLSYLTFFSSYFSRHTGFRSLNLVPFSTVLQYASGNMGVYHMLINLIGNIVAFMPLGFLSPLSFKSFRRFSRVLLLTFLSTVLIEINQYAFSVGVCDIDDVLLNILGGIFGYYIFIVLKDKIY